MDYTKTFSEKPFQKLKIIIPVFFIIWIFVLVIVSVNGIPKNGKAKGTTLQGFFLMITFAFVIEILIGAFAMSFVHQRVVYCDSKCCDVQIINSWNKLINSYSFYWRKVTKVEITSVYKQGLFIEITANHQINRIFAKPLFGGVIFGELLDLVNESTPHFPYIWKHKSQLNTQEVFDEVSGYCKIKRIY